VRRTRDGYYVGSNFPVDEKLARLETNFDYHNLGGSPLARKTRWEQLVAEHKGNIDVERVKQMESDSYDAFEKKDGPNERSLCGLVDSSPRGIPEWDWGKFFPGGTVQAKAVDGAMTEKMQFWAAMGHPCAPDFVADKFLNEHAEYRWMRGLLRDMKNAAVGNVHCRRKIKGPPGVSYRAVITGGTECYWVPISFNTMSAAHLRLFVGTV
jgi:hypothetical protein